MFKTHSIAEVRVCQSFHKKGKKLFQGEKDEKPKNTLDMPYNCVVCGDRLNKNKENEEHIVTNVEERRAGGKMGGRGQASKK